MRGCWSDVQATIYRTAGDDSAWLQGLVDSLQPVLDRGLGLYGYFVDANDLKSSARPTQRVVLGMG